MARFPYILSGIILLALFFTIGIACAADGDAYLNVSKVVSSTGPYEPGDPVTWTITLWNNGPENATNITLAEDVSGLAGLADISAVAEQGEYNSTSHIWNISELDNATSTHLTIITVFDTPGKKTNSVDITGLDQTGKGNRHAGATVHIINNAGAVIPDMPLSVNLAIRPTSLNLKSKGVFTVFVTLNRGNSEFPFYINKKSRVDFANSSLTCSGAEMISAGMTNTDGGTLIAKFHRQDLENVTSGAGVPITCSGTLSVNGKSVNIEGSDTIRVIGEKSDAEKFLSGLWRFLGIEKDDVTINETEDGNITLSVTLNPDTFKNYGQMKKVLKTSDDETSADTDNARNVSDKNGGPKENAMKNIGWDKHFQESNAGNNRDNGNKNTNKGNDESNEKSNGKKNR